MTTPNQARQSGRGGSIRTYAWPPAPPHEFEVVSVTTALKSLPKPYLVGWAAKVAAECAVEDLPIVTAMVEKGDKRAAIDHIKGASFRDMGKKADRGTIVHAALVGDGKVCYDVFTCTDMIAGIRIPKKIDRPVKDEYKDDYKDNFCDGR